MPFGIGNFIDRSSAVLTRTFTLQYPEIGLGDRVTRTNLKRVVLRCSPTVFPPHYSLASLAESDPPRAGDEVEFMISEDVNKKLFADTDVSEH